MTNQGTKRATPGADNQKNPLGDVVLSDEDAVKLQGVQKDITRVELALERRAQERMVSVYEKRRSVVKGINKFWPVALMNHRVVQLHAQHASDQAALSYLEDVWLVRDPVESRCFTLEFYFKENPYFSNTILKKEYKYIPPPVETGETPDADGITESMLEFSWERDAKPQATTIDWKDESKNLTKLHPRVQDEEEEDPSESGSFFNFFEVAEDPYDLGVLIANDVFLEAIDYFLGNVNEELDSEDEEDSDDDDEEEIDLEKPRPKKQKNA